MLYPCRSLTAEPSVLTVGAPQRRVATPVMATGLGAGDGAATGSGSGSGSPGLFAVCMLELVARPRQPPRDEPATMKMRTPVMAIHHFIVSLMWTMTMLQSLQLDLTVNTLDRFEVESTSKHQCKFSAAYRMPWRD